MTLEGSETQGAGVATGGGTGANTATAAQPTTSAAPASPAGPESTEARALSAAFEAAGIKPQAPAPATSAPAPQALTPEQLKFLGELDPAVLPPEIVERLDKHLLPAFTRKTQALAEEKRAFDTQRQQWLERMERVEKKFGSRDGDDLDEIRERARRGDPDAVEAYAQSVIEKELGPVKREQAYVKAVALAEQAEPAFKELKGEVFQQLQDQPVLQQLVDERGGAYAPLVLVALTREALLNRALTAITGLQKKVQETEQSFADRLKRGIEAHQKALRSLPPATSLAGSTDSVGSERLAPRDMAAAKAKLIAEMREAGLGD